MDFAQDVLHRYMEALLQFFIQPFYYIGILFIILQYRRQIALERKLFHTKLHSLFDETWRTVLWGLVGGFTVSLLMAFIGVSFHPATIIFLWVISLLLIMIRVRYLCFAYSAGILGVLHSIVVLFPRLHDKSEWSWMMDTLRNVHMPSLLALVAVLHFIEAMLIRWQGSRAASPLFFQGKRGKIVGGYHLHGFWPVPLFLIVPMQTGSGSSLPWSPLLGDGWSMGWTFVAFPVVIGFTELTLSRLPRNKVRWSSGRLMVYSIVVFIMAAVIEIWPILTIGASLLCIIFHEVLVWYSSWEESLRSPLYVHDERGLLILGVIPSSPAEEMGIQSGEIIHGVNGVKVTTKEQLHQALQLNPAFCKLEVINLEGQSKFLKRALFSGEHHQLGIILAPDQDAKYYVGLKQTHIGTYLRMKLTGLLQSGVKENKM